MNRQIRLMIWNTVTELLYPRRCPLCGEIVIPRGDLACPACRKSQNRITEPRCLQCGKPLESEDAVYCPDCEGRSFSYERGYALWQYDAVMRRSIRDFKYHGRQEYADYYVEQLLEAFRDTLTELELEAVIPVPVHRSRRRERGYNQAELLAEGVAQGLELPLLSDYLIRRLATRPQKELDPEARRRNLQTAFAVNTESTAWKYYWKRVLLVDDIYTTGSTVNACSQVLRQAGIGKVYVLCLCIGKGI